MTKELLFVLRLTNCRSMRVISSMLLQISKTEMVGGQEPVRDEKVLFLATMVSSIRSLPVSECVSLRRLSQSPNRPSLLTIPCTKPLSKSPSDQWLKSLLFHHGGHLGEGIWHSCKKV